MHTFPAPLSFKRRSTRVVSIGDLKVGGSHPISIQSMLTSDTRDVPKVLDEISALVAAQCELVRITVPNQRSVESMPAIREGMRARGLEVPLVADIHFNPKLALDSCEFFEKVRINPGNYADRKRFEIRDYEDTQYAEELERIEETFLPLIHNLKKYGCALRIGTNHGSLSDRIMNRYGDTPQGMVESALEFIRIAEKHDYREIIISMKSSIPIVMLQAYRLLVLAMDDEGMDYPLHLGVTEAGNGIDGRIKSAIGIGSLLNDGIGDTIRVSLTEAAENEIPAAASILENVEVLEKEAPSWEESALEVSLQVGKPRVQSVDLGQSQVGGEEAFRFYALDNFIIQGLESPDFDQVLCLPSSESSESPLLLLEEEQLSTEKISDFVAANQGEKTAKLVLVRGTHPLFSVRRLRQLMTEGGLDWPIGIVVPEQIPSDFWSGMASEIGCLIADGLVHALVTSSPDTKAPVFELCQLLLQSTRARLFKADFISCPSCGRTFFDLESTTEAIKQRTSHLKGVKIGIMGCIVNGPGEMADADFGYVGVGEGKINLYRKQECVARNIPESQAVDQLIALIQDHGEWVEPESETGV